MNTETVYYHGIATGPFKTYEMPRIPKNRLKTVKYKVKEQGGQLKVFRARALQPAAPSRASVVSKLEGQTNHERKTKAVNRAEAKATEPVETKAGVPKKGQKGYQPVPIVNVTIGTYHESQLKAAQAIGVAPVNVSQVLLGHGKATKGHRFRYATPIEQKLKAVLPTPNCL